MALSYGFFNSVNGDRKYNADDISNYFLKLISNGVFATPSNAMQVQAAGDMGVSVSAGWAFINCKWLKNSADYILALDASDVVLNRIDRIVVRLNADNSTRSMGIYVRKGIASATPAPPALIRTSTTYEISLAAVYVGAGVTDITQSNITDERGNTSVCGYVTGLIDQIDTTNLFAQYNAAFYEWFNEIKTEVTTTTLVRSYHSTYTTVTVNEDTIPINIPEYNSTLDVLCVYVNGLKLIEGTDYTIDGVTGTIELAAPLSVTGTPIEFEILKSIDGSDAEEVIQFVYELQNTVGKLTSNVYFCNGVNDNAKFIEFLNNHLNGQHDINTIRVIGTFGCNNNREQGGDGAMYSMVYVNDLDYKLTFDFSDCDIVNLTYGNGFAYFGNVIVKNLKINYKNAANSGAIIGIGAANCTLDGCSVSGALTGLYSVTAYSVTDTRMINCNADLSSYDYILGVAATKSTLTQCKIAVNSNSAAMDAYGINISDVSAADGCSFTATTAATGSSSKAAGGIGGGDFNDCVFVGKSALKAYGFFTTAGAAISATNCTFRGYTKNNVDGWGIGFSGANNSATTMLLSAITCNSVSAAEYEQTKGMTVGSGSGYYSGWFFDTPTMGSGIVSYGAFTQNRV